jgi:hypothetical protein
MYLQTILVKFAYLSGFPIWTGDNMNFFNLLGVQPKNRPCFAPLEPDRLVFGFGD